MCSNSLLYPALAVVDGAISDSSTGLRSDCVLAVAAGRRALIWLIAPSDTLRVDLAASVAALKGVDIRTVMVSGDARKTVEAVATTGTALGLVPGFLRSRPCHRQVSSGTRSRQPPHLYHSDTGLQRLAGFYVARERSRLWRSRPDPLLLASSSLDLTLICTLTAAGWLMKVLLFPLIAGILGASLLLAQLLDAVELH